MRQLVVVTGHIGKKPSIKQFAENDRKVWLRLSSQRRVTRPGEAVNTETDWHQVVVQGPLTKLAEKLTPGEGVTVVGHLRYRTYGNTPVTELVAREIHPASTPTVLKVSGVATVAAPPRGTATAEGLESVWLVLSAVRSVPIGDGRHQNVTDSFTALVRGPHNCRIAERFEVGAVITFTGHLEQIKGESVVFIERMSPFFPGTAQPD